MAGIVLVSAAYIPGSFSLGPPALGTEVLPLSATQKDAQAVSQHVGVGACFSKLPHWRRTGVYPDCLLLPSSALPSLFP